MQFSRDWYGDGTLPSVPGGPPFPASLSKAVLLSHELTDSLYKVKKMMHSSEVKLQAARYVVCVCVCVCVVMLCALAWNLIGSDVVYLSYSSHFVGQE